MNHTPIIEPADPGRRAAVALWLVDRALGAMIRDGTLHLRLPDGEMRHTAAKQRLSPGQKVLDIGPGWAGLVVTDLEVLRLHYAETLRAGRKRFMARHGEAALLYDERFCRMWEFYLAACEAGFLLNGLVVFQIQLARRFDTVPMTRSYIEAGERRLPAPPTATAQFGVGCQMGGAQVRTMAAE